MTDISQWLRGIDMGRYEDAFRQNDIDLAILRSLNSADLREIGVESVGHRRRILDAIAALGTDAVRDDADAAPVADNGPERRPLTVLFADLTGSTSLSAALDPEEMGALLKSYQNAVAGEVARFGGHIAKFMGDGVLAYFGWPQADEDVAERAARAGLAIVRAVADLPTPGQPLQARVGIATGLVVVGELVGSGAAREELVVGETPNLASRLQDIAIPGQVVIAPTTRARLGQSLQLRALPEVALKGFVAPVMPFEVVGDVDELSRFHAKRGRALLPLIGREAERMALLDAWAEADAGRGSGWLVVGPPGIGKSRLIETIVAEALQGRDEPMALQCSPFHGDTAFYPVALLVTVLAGLDAVETARAQQGRIARAMASFGHDPEQAPVLAWILDTGADAAGRGDQDARRMAMKALIGLVHRIAQDLPLLLIVEDVHWSDPTTLELIGRLLPTLGDHRILMLLTSRPELPERLAGDARLNRLVLERLDIASAERIASGIAGGIAGNVSLPAPLLAEIARRADGVPLFVEELTKTMLEAGARADQGAGAGQAGQGEALVIPATLHDSLLSRLDRLGPVKIVAHLIVKISFFFLFDFPEMVIFDLVDHILVMIVSFPGTGRSHHMLPGFFGRQCGNRSHIERFGLFVVIPVHVLAGVNHQPLILHPFRIYMEVSRQIGLGMSTSVDQVPVGEEIIVNIIVFGDGIIIEVRAYTMENNIISKIHQQPVRVFSMTQVIAGTWYTGPVIGPYVAQQTVPGAVLPTDQGTISSYSFKMDGIR